MKIIIILEFSFVLHEQGTLFIFSVAQSLARACGGLEAKRFSPEPRGRAVGDPQPRKDL